VLSVFCVQSEYVRLVKQVLLQKNGKTVYVLKGVTWKELANLYNESAPMRASFLIKNLHGPDGKPIPFEVSDDKSKETLRQLNGLSRFCKSFLSTTVPGDFFDDSKLSQN